MSGNPGRWYFAAQTLAGVAWWLGVFLSPTIRQATLGDLDPVLTAAFDIPLFVIMSALTALGVRWSAWIVAPWTALVTLGMILYATVTGLAGWGALLMIGSTVLSLASSSLILLGRFPSEYLLRGPFAFRTARAGSARGHATHTGLQLLVFWGLFLAVIPWLITVLEHRWDLHLEAPPPVRIAGAVIFAAASALGLWSALTMSTLGQGTPLPSAMPRELVIAGPYRYVRNPMAAAGIAQGASIGLMIDSWLVVAYALAGSLIWNTLVRPAEEVDLEQRFGAAFIEYRQRVSCWVPKLR
ncbi:methyltransferase family protein [Psychromicrobium xiongbiense]|uniref:methyltransferase family protein n=1 Tax=Psychromicrobium xiongbiense TaxID=3051184 RepID=UPI0025521C55|nr:isoprenylcysteine carboxylmethyltransferase family protein [Psychromicrobium sp. YIM S02556]